MNKNIVYGSNRKVTDCGTERFELEQVSSMRSRERNVNLLAQLERTANGFIFGAVTWCSLKWK